MNTMKSIDSCAWKTTIQSHDCKSSNSKKLICKLPRTFGM